MIESYKPKTVNLRLRAINSILLRFVKAVDGDLLTVVPPLNCRGKVLQLHGLCFGEVLVSFRHIQAIEPGFGRGMRSVKEQNVRCDRSVWRKNAVRHTDDRMKVKLGEQLSLIAILALSVPNRKPSGRMMAHRPFCFKRYMMTDIKRSAVSLLRRSAGKFCFTPSFSFPP